LRSGSYLLAISVLAATAGCASVNPSKPLVQPAAIGSATILSVRAVVAQEAAVPLRAALLAGNSGHDDRGRAPVEIIVRVDGGAVLSIVQENDAGFHAGDRVVIMRDDRTRLARPG
jgi:hypothetical protein